MRLFSRRLQGHAVGYTHRRHACQEEIEAGPCAPIGPRRTFFDPARQPGRAWRAASDQLRLERRARSLDPATSSTGDVASYQIRTEGFEPVGLRAPNAALYQTELRPEGAARGSTSSYRVLPLCEAGRAEDPIPERREPRIDTGCSRRLRGSREKRVVLIRCSCLHRHMANTIRPVRQRRAARSSPVDSLARQHGYNDYDDYLRSPAWAHTRRRYRDNCPWVCLCGSDKRLQLHHKTYKRLGAERLSDLQVLCDRCHSLVHQLQREGLIDIGLIGFFDLRRVVANRIERDEQQRRARQDIQAAKKARVADKFERRAEQDRRIAERIARGGLTNKQRKALRRQVALVRRQRLLERGSIEA